MQLARSFVPALLLIVLGGCCSTRPADLEDPDPDVRRETLACMAEAAPAEPGLREPAEEKAVLWLDPSEEPNVAVRAAAARVLATLGVVEATPRLAAVLAGSGARAAADPDPLVRQAAAAALGALVGDDAEEALRAALARDVDSDVRMAAARELGELDDPGPSTTRVLIERLTDESVPVRLHARRALRRIHGVDHGLDASTWESWYDNQQLGGEVAPEREEPPRAEDDASGEDGPGVDRYFDDPDPPGRGR